MNYTKLQNPSHTIYYDYAVLSRKSDNHRYLCMKKNESSWNFHPGFNRLPWPYYKACDFTWSMESTALIECLSENGQNDDKRIFY
ncbi:hypothetical protein AB6A40_011019 [Gnathostoma spinigerum]|uniref:Uncharacterized protein n=1 Tax=Gnathostoma spinigerum TaxID=75299 RepID=A0ABD6EXY1_9BILA